MRAFSLVVGLCAAALALGVPSTEEVVPEMELFDINHDDASSFEAARQTVASLTAAGKSDKDCRKLADDSKKEISASVKGAQKVLDAVPSGSQCASDYTTAVNKAKNLSSKADKAAKDAAKKKTKMCDVKVDFGKIHLDDLKPGKCGVFYSKSAYKNAAKACQDAKKAKAEAKGAKDEAAKNLKKVKASAAKAQLKCFCGVQAAHKKAWKAATANAAKNKKTWTKAHYMECALDHTPAKKCKVTKCPTVKKPAIIAAAAKADCKAFHCSKTGFAFYAQGGSKYMTYSNSAWTSSFKGNGEQRGKGWKKTCRFNQPAKKLRITIKASGTRTDFVVKVPNKSPQQLFQGGFTTSIPKKNWIGIGGGRSMGDFAWQPHCNRQGFSVRANHDWKVRFGILMNNENDCRTVDTMIGVGWGSEKQGMCGGARCQCCQKGGKCSNRPMSMEITVLS